MASWTLTSWVVRHTLRKGRQKTVRPSIGCSHNLEWIQTTSLFRFAEVLFGRLRGLRSTPNPDGSATTHVVSQCTLADISQATYLRVEDIAFALNECGLLQRRKLSESAEEGTEEVQIVISREMVEQVAESRHVKQLCILDLNRVLL